MPLYDYECPACSHRWEVVKRIALLDREEPCPFCSTVGRRLISPPLVANDYPPYNCPITGKLISGRREHIENLKRHGCRVYEPGETQEFLKRRQEREKKWDAVLESAVVDSAKRLGII